MDEQLAKKYVLNNDVLGLPQVYKNIKLYPLKVKDSDMLELFYNLMTYPKNFSANKEIMKMSYLKFMIYKEGSIENIEKIKKEFEKFLSYISKKGVEITAYKKNVSEKESLENICISVSFDKISLDESEFDELRAIVLEQNALSIEYVEKYNPELEALLNSHYQKNPLDFTDQVFTMAVLGHTSPSDISEYTLYQMQGMFDTMLVLKDYDVYQPLVSSGAVKLKTGEIKHYLYHRSKKGRYDNILISMDAYLDKNKEIFGGIPKKPQTN